MLSQGLNGRVGSHLEASSSSGRSELLRRGLGKWSQQRPTFGVVRAQPLSALPAACEAARPPAGPSTILCSSLGKERKKLAKVLKSHRKVLEKRLSALAVTEVNAPVLSELLTELRILRSHLESQRAAFLFRNADDSDSSDSDDECTTRSLSSLAATCSRRQQASDDMSSSTSSHSPAVAASATSTTTTTTSPLTSSMIISGLRGQMEVAVPEPQEGWDWDEEAFRATQFPGAAGRIMVCTGSKCQRKGGAEVLRAVSALSENNPAIEVVPCKCVGKCSAGAALRVRPAGQACATYTQVRPAQLEAVFQEHFGGDRAGAAAMSPFGAPAVVGASELQLQPQPQAANGRRQQQPLECCAPQHGTTQQQQQQQQGHQAVACCAECMRDEEGAIQLA